MEAKELLAVIEQAIALCDTMDRGVGYRVQGKIFTWDAYHEGKSDFAGEVENLLLKGIRDKGKV